MKKFFLSFAILFLASFAFTNLFAEATGKEKESPSKTKEVKKSTPNAVPSKPKVEKQVEVPKGAKSAKKDIVKPVNQKPPIKEKSDEKKPEVTKEKSVPTKKVVEPNKKESMKAPAPSAIKTNQNSSSGKRAEPRKPSEKITSAQPKSLPKENSDKENQKKQTQTPSEQPVVAQVNGEPVGVYPFEKLLIEQLQNGTPDSVELRKKIREELVVQTLLSQKAMEEGLDQNNEIQLAFEDARRKILASSWRQNWAQQNPLKEDEILKEYNKTIKNLGSTEYQLRQVVVSDETAALLVFDQLAEGKDLGELAMKYTNEVGGKKTKGLLPWVSPSLLLPPLGEMISDKQAGQLLESPVRTKAGWHIVKIEGVRPIKAPTLDQLRPQLNRSILQAKMTQKIQELLDGAKISF